MRPETTSSENKEEPRRGVGVDISFELPLPSLLLFGHGCVNFSRKGH